MQEPQIKQSHEEIEELVDCIDSFGKGLNKWEVNFIAGLVDNPPEEYSPNRREVINRIYREKV